MRTLLPLLLLLPFQDAHTLAWSPPEGKVIVAKVKCARVHKEGSGQYESEVELHPGESNDKGRTVRVRVIRLVIKQREGDETSEFTYERGKKAVIVASVSRREEGEKMAESLTTDDKATLTPQGKLVSEQSEPRLAVVVALGLVDLSLPEAPVRVKETWTKEVQIPFEDTDFFARLAFTLERVGDAAAIVLKATERGGKISGEEELTWTGEGSMTFSLKDRVVRDFKFKAAQKDAKGKEVRSMKQELTVTLK